MLGSEFVATYKDKGLAAWEAAALALAQEGSSVAWPMVDLSLSAMGPSGARHEGILPVASDVFAIGTPEDHLRLPLRPAMAQTIANLTGSLLPTPKIAYEVWKAAQSKGVQLVPAPQVNKGMILTEYAKHDATIKRQLTAASLAGTPLTFGSLISGHKKDVVISNIYKPGRVLIYGWFWPVGMKVPANYSQPIQARSNEHVADWWVDYSHGIRFVSPVMTVDGVTMKTEDVLHDPELSKLLSDEGPVRMVRYPPLPGSPEPQPYRPVSREEYRSYNDVYPRPNTTSLADQGLAALLADQAARRRP